MIGDGSDEERCHATAWNCQGVIFTQFVDPAELPSYYAESDAFVAPSL